MLKIGDKLYKRVGMVGILTFTVYEIRKQKNLTLYAVSEDRKGYALLVVEDNQKDIYHFVSMLDENEDGYLENNPNSLGLDSEYFTTKTEAIKWTLTQNIKALNRELKDYENKASEVKKKISEYELHLKDIDTLEEYYMEKYGNQ